MAAILKEKNYKRTEQNIYLTIGFRLSDIEDYIEYDSNAHSSIEEFVIAAVDSASVDIISYEGDTYNCYFIRLIIASITNLQLDSIYKNLLKKLVLIYSTYIINNYL